MKTPPGGKTAKKTPRTTKDVALAAFRADPTFVGAVAAHRHWTRVEKDLMPA